MLFLNRKPEESLELQIQKEKIQRHLGKTALAQGFMIKPPQYLVFPRLQERSRCCIKSYFSFCRPSTPPPIHQLLMPHHYKAFKKIWFWCTDGRLFQESTRALVAQVEGEKAVYKQERNRWGHCGLAHEIPDISKQLEIECISGPEDSHVLYTNQSCIMMSSKIRKLLHCWLLKNSPILLQKHRILKKNSGRIKKKYPKDVCWRRSLYNASHWSEALPGSQRKRYLSGKTAQRLKGRKMHPCSFKMSL